MKKKKKNGNEFYTLNNFLHENVIIMLFWCWDHLIKHFSNLIFSFSSTRKYPHMCRYSVYHPPLLVQDFWLNFNILRACVFLNHHYKTCLHIPSFKFYIVYLSVFREWMKLFHRLSKRCGKIWVFDKFGLWFRSSEFSRCLSNVKFVVFCWMVFFLLEEGFCGGRGTVLFRLSTKQGNTCE